MFEKYCIIKKILLAFLKGFFIGIILNIKN